jgi:sarcosine oxidase
VSVTYDVVVAGLGAMGSAACDQLAGRGLSVIGFDRFRPPHTEGSSHGESRIIREAYFEHPSYVPIVQRAYECWSALERDSGRPLLRVTGGLMIGPEGGTLVSGALRSAREHGLAHELLGAREVRARYPALALGDAEVAVFEPRAGVLDPESCLAAQLERAGRRGAELRGEEPVVSWRADGEGVEVTTTRGRYRAARLVIAAGAWANDLLAGLALPLVVERQALYWFEPAGESGRLSPGRFPIYIWEHERGRYIYGFPLLARGLKVARHHEGEPCTPGTVRREVSPAEIASMEELVARKLPGATARVRETATCLYTNTPDEDFVIGAHPRHAAVLVASPCSGHGFKFAGAIGEIVADLVTSGRSRFDLSRFRVDRFAAVG